METMRPGGRGASSVAGSSRPQNDPRDAAPTGRWTNFLQLYGPLLTREMAQQHPQFIRALRQLERDSRLEQDRQSAQVLATLRLKDARICELQKVVSEQREQLDVVLDELERRETKEDKAVQADEERTLEDISVHPESLEKETKTIETQTEVIEAESGVLLLLEKLETELQTLEERNLALEKELQQRMPKRQEKELSTEEDERMEACLVTLQRGVDAMNLSCSCVDNPLAYFAGVPDDNNRKDDGKFSVMSTCVNLEHQLEAQTVRLEHVQECLHMWREAAVQLMKQQNIPEGVVGPIVPSISTPLIAHCDERDDAEMVNCSVALRGALAQIREHLLHCHYRCNGDGQQVLKDLARTLAKGKSSAKVAAKIVQKWAGWESKHLDEVRNLRQGFEEERAVNLSRRMALLKRIDQFEQRELDLQAEMNALRKKFNSQEGMNGSAITSFSPSNKPTELLLGTDKWDGALEYPQLVLKLAIAEQSLLSKDEQLAAANDTIRALSSFAPISPIVSSSNSSFAQSNDTTNSMNRLAVELQRASKQKIDFFRRREKDLINVCQYFQMEKLCLQLQSRFEAEQKHGAMMKAAINVCEQERDELLMKVEKLETESMLARISPRSAFSSLPSTPQDDKTPSYDDYNNALFVAVRRLRLVEDDRKIMRKLLRHFQQQVILMKQQRPNDGQVQTKLEPKLQTSVLDCVAEHHQKCVGEFKEFINRQSCSQPPNSLQHETKEDNVKEIGWAIFLSHYEALWIAFHFLYSSLGQLLETSRLSSGLDTKCGSILRAFGYQVSRSAESNSYLIQQLNLEALELEVSKRDEKILLLQQKLMDREENPKGDRRFTDADCCSDSEVDYLPINAAEYDIDCNSSEKYPIELVYNQSEDVKQYMRMSDAKQLPESGRPFLALTKPHKPPPQPDSISSNGSSNEATLVPTPERKSNTKSMECRELTAGTARELEKCLATCAHLTSQNTKLIRRLRAEKETRKQILKEQENLRAELNARTDDNSELQHTLERYQDQVPSASIRPAAAMQSEGSTGNNFATVDASGNNAAIQMRVSEEAYEAVKEQLASREQENLALVQSLCTIKEKIAQMEIIHQKELRVKAAEHAEGMESYLATVNETLTRIESDKLRIEDENVKLRLKVQQLELDGAQRASEQTQRSSKGTNTESETQTLEPPELTRENDLLRARVEDLEVQLSRERKLAEVVGQKLQLENQQEEQLESQVKMDAAKAKQEYVVQCEDLCKWRTKLEHEFAEYQTVQSTVQQESDRRIEFLSACIEEFVRLTDATSPAGCKTVSTKGLYEAVMALARDPPRAASRELGDSSKKQPKHTSRTQSLANTSQQFASRGDAWDDVLKREETEQDDSEISEMLWWKLRASKLEAYVRSANAQNDTFEDTIRQLEMRMRDLKEELSVRLTHEAQLVSKLAAIKSELVNTKEQAALLAEKYQQTSAELDQRQGEASSRGDEMQRARMAVQRKTELLSQQKAKVVSLQQELEQATKKLERLTTAEKQAALLQQKAKEHTQQLQHARQSYERCHDDNVQLSFHLEKIKERHAGVVARLKAARAENAHLRAQCTELKSSGTGDTRGARADGFGKDGHRGNQVEVNAVSVASLTEETRSLKRRVLQKQDVIVSYKAKVSEYEAQLERQRETMVKLARSNRELQQGQRQRQQQEQEYTSAIHAKLESQLNVKQDQLDGLRASVYDSFEAFVFCRRASTSYRTLSPSSSCTLSRQNSMTDDDDGSIFAIKRWTDFSVQDLEELKLTRGPQQSRHKHEKAKTHVDGNPVKRKAATAALREVESALEITPEDCRGEICELLQCLCD